MDRVWPGARSCERQSRIFIVGRTNARVWPAAVRSPGSFPCSLVYTASPISLEHAVITRHLLPATSTRYHPPQSRAYGLSLQSVLQPHGRLHTVSSSSFALPTHLPTACSHMAIASRSPSFALHVSGMSSSWDFGTTRSYHVQLPKCVLTSIST